MRFGKLSERYLRKNERIFFDDKEMLLGSFICEDDKIYSSRNWKFEGSV